MQKKTIVKTSFQFYLATVAAVLALQCSSKNLALMPQDFRGGGLKDLDTISRDLPDTLQESEGPNVYVSAVIAPDGYDWRRDSCYGSTGMKIILLKNYKEILSLDTGKDCLVSSEPDLHHIINGHLYTEYASNTHTIIKKDGKELFRYPGREWLKGILPVGDSTYTLGQSRDGNGFSFRLDGQTVLAKSYGTVNGGFTQCNCDSNGALYYSDGAISFDYWADSVRVHVSDGVEYARNKGIYSQRIFFMNGDRYGFYEYHPYSGIDVEYNPDGTITLPEGIPDGSYYFFPTEGGYYYNGSTYLALTPRDKNRKPFIWADGECSEIDINGFLTGIEIIPEENQGQDYQETSLEPSSSTLMDTLRVSSGRISSMFSGHSIRQRQPLSM